MAKLNLNGVDVPSFVKVGKIKHSLHPPVTQTKTKVAGRPGSVNYGSNLEDRYIEIEIGIKADSKANLPQRKRELTDWFFYTEPKKLILPKEPNIYYMAQIQGTVDLDEILNLGKGTIVFVCTDPYGYAVSETVVPFAPVGETPVTITNNGQVEVQPKISVEFTQNVTEFGLISGEEFVLFGQPLQVDTQTPKIVKTVVLNDDCSTTTGWTAGSTVDGGAPAGTLSSDGFRFSQTNNDFGTGTTWHGGALVKTLNGNVQVQDFTVEADIALNPNALNQIGRVEIYLLDVNGAHIGKIAMKDMSTTLESPQLEARAGSLASGTLFVAYQGKKPGYFKDFEGIIRISRKGNVWTCWAGNRDSKGNYFNTFTHQFVDTQNLYMTKLARVQVHLAAYGTSAPVSRMFVTNVKVTEDSVPLNNEVPYIFQAGDKLEVDCASGEIRKNGEVYYDSFNPGSTYITLKKGVNGIIASPSGVITNGTITYREMWL